MQPSRRKKPEEDPYNNSKGKCVLRSNAQTVGKPAGLAVEGMLLPCTSESREGQHCQCKEWPGVVKPEQTDKNECTSTATGTDNGEGATSNDSKASS